MKLSALSLSLALLTLASCASKPTFAPEVAVVAEKHSREPAGLASAIEKFRELIDATKQYEHTKSAEDLKLFQKQSQEFNKALPKLGAPSFGGMHSTVFAVDRSLVVRVFRHKASPIPKEDFGLWVNQALQEARIDASDFNIKPSMKETWMGVGSKSETMDMVAMKISISKISETQLKTLLRRLSALNEGSVQDAF